jgi:maltose alpha-D-glucosyltransferase/alpha-amylase
LSSFFERAAARSREQPPAPPLSPPIIGPSEHEARGPGDDLIEGYHETARTLAWRTAEMHRALSEAAAQPAFAPEPFGKLYQRSIYQTMRNMTGRLCHRLARERGRIPPDARRPAERLVALQEDVLKRFRAVLDPELGGYRVRCHGDFHLGQLLFTGKDYVIVDFEGEANRTIGERRLKRSPLRDVASMVRSFDYAVQSVFLGLASSRGRSPGLIREEDRNAVAPWVLAWYNRVARVYVTEYLTAMGDSSILPPAEYARRTLLELFLLEKALHEIDSDLTHRPDWVAIPLRAALRLLGVDPDER